MYPFPKPTQHTPSTLNLFPAPLQTCFHLRASVLAFLSNQKESFLNVNCMVEAFPHRSILKIHFPPHSYILIFGISFHCYLLLVCLMSVALHSKPNSLKEQGSCVCFFQSPLWPQNREYMFFIWLSKNSLREWKNGWIQGWTNK